MKIKVDLVIVIDFDLNKPNKTVIRTNIKKKLVGEFLGDWVRMQAGIGGDEDEPDGVEKDRYSIKIGIDLSDDTFITESNTGNDGLTCGIVMDVLTRIDSLTILPL